MKTLWIMTTKPNYGGYRLVNAGILCDVDPLDNDERLQLWMEKKNLLGYMYEPIKGVRAIANKGADWNEVGFELLCKLEVAADMIAADGRKLKRLSRLIPYAEHTSACDRANLGSKCTCGLERLLG